MRSEPPGESDRTDPTARTREPPARGRPAIVALTGNPNTGKTTLFNALTGYRRHVANYPGVTVDVGRGAVRGVRVPMELLDLPGTYSLAAVSPDEMAVTNVTCGRVAGERGPDCILAIADASNLPRNLYLISQLLELGLPVVIALNMVDIAQSRGITFDCERLSQRLGIAVVPVVATRKKTIPPLVEALERAASGTPPPVLPDLPPMLIEESAALRDALEESLQPAEALRVLLDRDGHAE
ncbi:MAG TPA: FeoB small GTPase domain-containing protein, partial [Phycisphaerae bacterium]|nr:FeoB small GTPase domain-containing protein [Phycisphaerae bacterium]